MADDLSLVIGGRKISGWDSARVTRGIERCPSDFDIAMTERYQGSAMVVQPQDECQVLLGGDPVITGYVDIFAPGIDARSHTIRVAGRSKSEDLVDCAAEWPGGQISGSSALEIAKKLAQPYGITVKAEADTGAPIPQFNLTIGETAYAIIERVCRYRGLLIYDLPDGSVTLAQAGGEKMSSGLVQGKNVMRAVATYSADQRFSKYDAFLQSMDVLGDTGDGGNLLATVNDPGMKRHRQRDIIAEAGGGGLDVAKQRALWECARRAGRSYSITATVDSWRDTGGKLWTPNATVPLELPALKLPSATWVIAEVTFNKNAEGTSADILAMPRDAFLPEPILIQPFAADVAPQ
jgi:prophage tail gpP-like protein